MSDTLISALDRSLAFVEQVVGTIDDNARPRPTPCPEFDVTALVGHLASITLWYARIPASGVGDLSAIKDDDLTNRDLPAVFHAHADQARSAWTTQELDRVFPASFGDTTGTQMTSYMVMELLSHGIDLTMATGQTVNPDDDLLQMGIAVATGMGEAMLRAPKMMGPAVTVADDAPLRDRFLGLLGRDPAWTPSV